MRTRLRTSALTILLGACLASRAFAGGFEIYEESPAGTAMNGAMTALPGDASAIFYNPAGIAMQPSGGFVLGTSLAFGSTTITTADGVVSNAKSQLFTLPTAFVSAHIGSRLAAGLGVFTHFGNGVEFDGGTKNGMNVAFPGRFVGWDTQLQSVTLNPTLAVLANDHVSFGIGLDVVLAAAEIKRQVLLGDVEAGSHLGGTADAVGWNFGVQAVLVPRRLSIGFAYRAGFDLDFDMKAHFDVPPELSSQLKDQQAKTTLTMPHNFSVGVAIHPTMKTTISADVHVSLWSDFKALTVTFPTTDTPPISAAQNWRDTVTARLGFEWMAAQGLALRLGFGYDQSPVPQSTLGPSAPVSDRWLVTGGLSYALPRTAARGLGLGVGYLAGISSTRNSTSPDLYGAAYGQTVHVVSVALTYRWGGPTECDPGSVGLDCRGQTTPTANP